MTRHMPTGLCTRATANVAPAGTRGFTLIETLAVFAIFGLVAALVLPHWSRPTTRPRLEAYALQLAALLQTDHSTAILRHSTMATLIDVNARRVHSGSGQRDLHLPDDILFESVLAKDCIKAVDAPAIVFFAGGMSCGGTLILSRPGMSYAVHVNWLTGGTDIAAR